MSSLVLMFLVADFLVTGYGMAIYLFIYLFGL